MSDLGKAYVQIIPKAEGISNKIKDQVAPGAKQAGSEAGTSIAGNIKKVLAGAAIGATVVRVSKRHSMRAESSNRVLADLKRCTAMRRTRRKTTQCKRHRRALALTTTQNRRLVSERP